MTLARESGIRLKQHVEASFLDRYALGERRILARGEGVPAPVAGPTTFVALDGLGREEDWRATLLEWLTALPEGGRVVLGLPSGDHLRAAKGEGAGGVAVADLARFATAAGASLLAVEPCGTLYWDGEPNHWLAGSLAEDSHYWRRYLSWLDQDEALFALGCFLHETLVSRLGTAATERYLAVVEKRAGSGEGEAARIAALNAPAFPLTAERVVPPPVAEWVAALEGHLSASLRCRMYLYRLFSAAWAFEDRVDWRSFLPPRLARDFNAWREMERRDHAVVELAKAWHREEVFGDLLTYQGVPLGPGLEYELVQTLLAQYDGVFVGGRA